MLPSLVVFLPAAGGVAAALAPARLARGVGVTAAALTLLLAAATAWAFAGADAGPHGYKLVTDVPWVGALGVRYAMVRTAEANG